MDWNAAQVAQLKALWAEGWSASLIADRLGTTRNAIIGKVSRLGLDGRRPVRTRAPYIRKKRPAMSTVPAKVAPLQPHIPAQPRVRVKPLSKLLEHECRWPADLPHRLTHFPAFHQWRATTHFCAAATREGEVYCPFHQYHAHPQRKTA